MNKLKGFATTIVLVVTVIALGIGLYFQHLSDAIDHPLEQTSEAILKKNGIDVDFSKDKKEALNEL